MRWAPPPNEWRTWFAWRPVYCAVDRSWVWLEDVWRWYGPGETNYELKDDDDEH